MQKPLIVGNWKMQGSLAQIESFMLDFLPLAQDLNQADVVFCPPFVYLEAFRQHLTVKNSTIGLGAQNVHFAPSGAHTGEISASMLVDLGCQYVIIGHCERRQEFGESDSLILNKILAAQTQGLIPIVCLGETQSQRAANKTFEVIASQLEVLFNRDLDWANCIIAYEPIWAIGTGLSATPQQAEAVHHFIRTALEKQDPIKSCQVRLLYGGSVKPDNAANLFAMQNIDGGLVGGASLKADDFFKICKATEITGQ